MSDESPVINAALNFLIKQLAELRADNKALAQEIRAFVVYHPKDMGKLDVWADRLDK